MGKADFKILNQLGKGSYGVVYKVRRIADSREYALKEVNLREMTQRERFVDWDCLSDVR